MSISVEKFECTAFFCQRFKRKHLYCTLSVLDSVLVTTRTKKLQGIICQRRLVSTDSNRGEKGSRKAAICNLKKLFLRMHVKIFKLEIWEILTRFSEVRFHNASEWFRRFTADLKIRFFRSESIIDYLCL